MSEWDARIHWIRNHYAAGMNQLGMARRDMAVADFDEWLAEHDRRVKADAWAEGVSAAMAERGDCLEQRPDGTWINPKNPYRDVPSLHGGSAATDAPSPA